jgi:hypothetical protein
LYLSPAFSKPSDYVQEQIFANAKLSEAPGKPGIDIGEVMIKNLIFDPERRVWVPEVYYRTQVTFRFQSDQRVADS